MPPVATKPKDQIINMLQHVKTTGECFYTFDIPLGPDTPRIALEAAVQNYIQRMRVELSRMRKAVKRRNQQLKRFSILRKSVVPVTGGARVTLEYREGETKLYSELSEIFDLVSTGERLLDDKELRGLPKEPPPMPSPAKFAQSPIKLGGSIRVKSE